LNSEKTAKPSNISHCVYLKRGEIMKAIQIATFTALLLSAFIIGATLSGAAHAQNAPLNFNNSPLNFENSPLNYIANNGV
jgi:hypothetical protein